MSGTIDIRRYGDEWIIEDSSARIRVTNPSAGIIDRFVDQWEEQATAGKLLKSQAADGQQMRP